MYKLALRLAYLFAAACPILFGQNIAGTSSISGTVTDPTGAPVAGAQVLVENQSKGIRRDLQTTSSGLFSAPSLVPAEGYRVTINAPGFSAYELKDMSLAVGQNLNLTPRLRVSSSMTNIEISLEAPIVDTLRSDVSQVVGTQQIQDLPINGRRVDSFVLLAPAVVPDGTFGLLSFRGIAGGNAFLTDGNDTTEQFFNENAGRTRISSQISQDAVQEFQVVSNNYSAEFGRAMGGIVNTVTRSGTNDLHGTAYWFFRNQDFNARDPFATMNPKERRDQFGTSLGGPIVRDKLFYFFNYEGTKRDFPIIASITAPGSSLFNTAGQIIQPCNATAAQCAAATSFFNRQFQTLPRTVNQNLGFGKLDWRPTENNSFSASFNILRWVSPNGLQTQAVLNNGFGMGNNANSSVRAKYGRLTWTNVASPWIVNELRLSWFNDKQYDYPSDALMIPGIGFLGINFTGQNNLGTATDYPRTNPLENRYQISDTLSWTIGEHSLKFGGDFLYTNDHTDALFNRTGTYTYANLTNFALDLAGNITNAKRYLSYSQTIGKPVVNLIIRDYDVFIQDQYKPMARLTLNLGWRYDYSALPQPTLFNPDYPATGRIPTFGSAHAPRVGFAYALDSTGKTVLRGGYGIFYARYPGGTINTFFLGNGLYQKSILLNNRTLIATGPVFPNPIPNTGNYNPTPGSVNLTMAASAFRAPYTQQADLAIERQLTNSMSLAVSGIWSRGLHLTSVNDINIGAPGPVVTYSINDAGGNQVGTYSTPIYITQNRVDMRYSRVNIVDAGLNSYYNALAVQLNKGFSRGLIGNIVYTWSHAIDYGQGNAGAPNVFASGGPQSYMPGNYRAEKGSSALDARHRLVFNGVYSPTLTHSSGALARHLMNGWQLSAIGTFQSSFPTTPTVQIASAYTPNSTLYIPAITGSLNGYASSRVPFLPPGSLKIDQIIRVDARIAKDFNLNERLHALFTFDAFNVGNNTYFTSVATRAYTVAQGSSILNPAPGYGAGTATQGFPDGTNARRLQLGVRLNW
jgi:hypothetical protein